MSTSGNSQGDRGPSETLARRTRRGHHGAYAFMSTGTLPARLSWLQPEVDRFRDGLLSDLGGTEAATTAESALVLQAGRLFTICALLSWQIFTRAATTRGGDLKPAVTALATYENSLRLTLTSLGLQRKARKVDSYVAGVLEREREARRSPESSDPTPAETSTSTDPGGDAGV